MNVDGPEQRLAQEIEREVHGADELELAEQIADEERNVKTLTAAEVDVGAAIDKVGATALVIKMQRDSLADTLRDIALGAQMMLEPSMHITGTFERYVREVLRVAREGIKEAQV